MSGEGRDMPYATLVTLAQLAGYEVTMPCHDLSTRPLVLSRGGTELAFCEVRDLVVYLRGQVDMMAELADRLD